MFQLIKMILIFWRKIWKLLGNAGEAHFLSTLHLHLSGTVVMFFSTHFHPYPTTAVPFSLPVKLSVVF